jgi:hypothetical protein
MKPFLILICAYLLACNNVFAQKTDSASLRSIVEALQEQARKSPPVFPLESYQGGIQSIEDGLRQAYFGYGERRYASRTDFHPAMDVGYFPTETGLVTTEQGESVQVRAPQTYLKKVYAIQKGEFVSIAHSSYGYKIVLKHKLEKPYYDNEGNAWYHYYTCYRHLDSRSLSHLDGIARKFTGDPAATYAALAGKYVFEAGEQIALAGFPPADNPDLPRAHLDFSLNLFDNPNKGENIRNYALNPLLLFPPFEYADPQSHVIASNGLPAYQFGVDEAAIVVPGKGKDGQFVIRIQCGGHTAQEEYAACRYFALNAVDVLLFNDGKLLGSHHLDRHRKLGYRTDSYELLDAPDTSAPWFFAPLGVQEDVYEMTVVLPDAWFRQKRYDWSESGAVTIGISSIWNGYLQGHSHSLTIPLPSSATK